MSGSNRLKRDIFRQDLAGLAEDAKERLRQAGITAENSAGVYISINALVLRAMEEDKKLRLALRRMTDKACSRCGHKE